MLTVCGHISHSRGWSDSIMLLFIIYFCRGFFFLKKAFVYWGFGFCKYAYLPSNLFRVPSVNITDLGKPSFRESITLLFIKCELRKTLGGLFQAKNRPRTPCILAWGLSQILWHTSTLLFYESGISVPFKCSSFRLFYFCAKKDELFIKIGINII